MRVLVVDEDAGFRGKVTRTCKSESLVVQEASSGEEGLEIARHYPHDLIVLEPALADMPNLGVLWHMRDSKIDAPILALSRLSDCDTKVRALHLGADDFMTKPFDRKELLARLYAIARRAHGHARSAISINGLSVDLGSGTASYQKEHVPLTNREYQVLRSLALRAGKAISRSYLLDSVCSDDEEVDERMIDAVVCRLRRKLAGASGGKEYIDTIRGKGYILHAPA